MNKHLSTPLTENMRGYTLLNMCVKDTTLCPHVASLQGRVRVLLFTERMTKKQSKL